VRKNLSSAIYIGAVNPGSLNGSAATPGAILYWVADNWSGSADGKPEVGEIAVIQHDPTTQTLWLYQTIPVATMNSGQLTLASAVWNYGEITSPTYITTFTAPTPTGLYGNYVKRTALGRNVIGATFAVTSMSSTTQRPVVEVTLVISRAPQPAMTQYESIVVRAPAAQPQ
jgi:hypothetical protein